MRIGHGYDVHRFGGDKPLVLGGVHIKHSAGVVAHSDGDVLIHALCDALLGAAGLGDIGRHFPDSSDQYANIDSRLLLRRVMGLLAKQDLAVVNVDMTLVAQAPKLVPYIDAMVENLAADLECGQSQVNIKATTTEGLGVIGRGEGIASYAVALLAIAAS